VSEQNRRTPFHLAVLEPPFAAGLNSRVELAFLASPWTFPEIRMPRGVAYAFKVGRDVDAFAVNPLIIKTTSPRLMWIPSWRAAPSEARRSRISSPR
jgi:hypothetical protein